MRSPAEAWIGSLGPWPEEFGLTGSVPCWPKSAIRNAPSRRSTSSARTASHDRATDDEALLEAEGLEVGAYTSPHVRGWAERIRIGGAEADFEEAVEAVRDAAMRLGSTQFEALTAAALAAFARAGVDVAVVEAGLGGRYDATNVLDARVVLLTNVALEHTEVLGGTRESIAAEKLAVVRPGVAVVLGEPEWEELARANGATTVRSGGPREAAEAFLGRPVEAEVEVVLPRAARVVRARRGLGRRAHARRRRLAARPASRPRLRRLRIGSGRQGRRGNPRDSPARAWHWSRRAATTRGRFRRTSSLVAPAPSSSGSRRSATRTPPSPGHATWPARTAACW